MRHLAAIAVAALLAATPNLAAAWGASGHRMLGEAAMRALPADIPAFLRTRQAVLDVGELSRELDRSKGAGKIHDSDRNPGHFVDMDEDGRILGGPLMTPLASTRAEYETALRAAGIDQWKAGYLPYAIVDRWQQLTADLAYWRVLKAAESNPRWIANRPWFVADRRRREALILKSLGELSHLVGDGSQPLHVTTHSNGWGDYPNPNGYSTARPREDSWQCDVLAGYRFPRRRAEIVVGVLNRFGGVARRGLGWHVLLVWLGSQYTSHGVAHAATGGQDHQHHAA